MARWLAHLCATQVGLRRRFTPAVLAAIESAIHASETIHGGEIRFAIEARLDLESLAGGATARARALEVFAELGVWDTEQRNGVLIYVLLAEHAIEIVADRGYAGRVGAGDWQAICAVGEQAFAAGRYGPGALAMIASAGALIAAHFPPRPGDRDELPNRPTLL